MCNFIFLCPSNSLKCSKAIRLHVSKRQFFGSINILISPGLGDICHFFPLDVCSHNGPHWHHWVKKKIQVPKSVLLKMCNCTLCQSLLPRHVRFGLCYCIKMANLAHFWRQGQNRWRWNFVYTDPKNCCSVSWQKNKHLLIRWHVHFYGSWVFRKHRWAKESEITHKWSCSSIWRSLAFEVTSDIFISCFAVIRATRLTGRLTWTTNNADSAR